MVQNWRILPPLSAEPRRQARGTANLPSPPSRGREQAGLISSLFLAERHGGIIFTIPGVQRRTAEVMVAEIGADMSRFHSAAHLSSWAGMCPGNHESAGKRRSGKTRPGNRWLRTALVEAGGAAGRTKLGYPGGVTHCG
jgi:transposase